MLERALSTVGATCRPALNKEETVAALTASAFTAPMAAAYWTAYKEAVPVVMRGDYRTENAFGRHERLILPWMIDRKVARLTGCLDRFPPDPK